MLEDSSGANLKVFRHQSMVRKSLRQTFRSNKRESGFHFGPSILVITSNVQAQSLAVDMQAFGMYITFMFKSKAHTLLQSGLLTATVPKNRRVRRFHKCWIGRLTQ